DGIPGFGLLGCELRDMYGPGCQSVRNCRLKSLSDGVDRVRDPARRSLCTELHTGTERSRTIPRDLFPWRPSLAAEALGQSLARTIAEMAKRGARSRAPCCAP